MAAPKRIDELTAGTSLSAGAAVAVVQDGATLRFPASAFITQSESFTQSGTGAISRTAQDKLRERRDVRDMDADPADSVALQTTAIQAAIDALVSGDTLHIDKAYSVTGLTITNKTDIKITGKGSLTLSGAASGAYIFQLVGTIDNLTIEGLELVGEANAAYTQTAIGNASGQTISNVWFVRNKISGINNGISLNADLSGSYTKGHVLNNSISSLAGTASGQGYGIHLAKATQCIVSGNVIDGATRHSIYQASGTDVGNLIYGNHLKNHRASVADTNIRPAIFVARSGGVVVANNIIEDASDGGMAVQQESSVAGCTDIDVIGNIFRGRANAVAHLYVGEQAVPGTEEVTHVRIRGNAFYTDYSVANNNDIVFHNGRFIEFSNNSLRKDNVSGSARFVTWGHNTYISADDDFNHCFAEGNTFIAEGSALTDVRGFHVASDVCGNTSYHRLDNRKSANMTSPTIMDAVPTNPNLMVISERRCHVLNGTGAGVGAGTTAGKARTNAAVRIAYRRTTVSIASTNDYWDLTGVSTGASEFRKVLLCVDSGATARIVVGDIAASQTAAVLPRLPDYDWAALGVVEIGQNYSGGALGALTFYDVVGHYEQ